MMNKIRTETRTIARRHPGTMHLVSRLNLLNLEMNEDSFDFPSGHI